MSAEGPCVIVGRCADYILRDNENLVNVFIHSDIENRVKRVVTYYNVQEDKARDVIKKTDKKRASYYSYYTGHRWGEADNYEISLNSDKIGIDNCVDILYKYIISIE